MRPTSRPSELHPSAAVAMALAAIALLAAAPATARAPQPDGSGRVVPAADPSNAILGDAERRAASNDRKPVDPGPFVPVVGRADMGTAENAFGASRSGHVHAGHDIFAAAGTPLVAPAKSRVVEAGSDGGRGNFVALHDERRRLTYVYFHMSEAATVRPGERVAAGERVGSVGCTGSCWGDHLHFEVRRGTDAYGAAIDPMPLLSRWKSLDRPR